MSELGAILQKYNQELVKYIEQLKLKRNNLSNDLDSAHATRQQLVEQIDALKKELEKIDENIARQTEQRNDLDKTLNEADLGLKKIVESSQVILTAVKRESSHYLQQQSKKD